MRFRSMVIKGSIVLGALAILSIASVRWHGSSPDREGSSGVGISLIKPAFAQESGVSFLDREAGIAAYADVGRSIDLAKAKSVFRTVERETGQYVIGSVPLPYYQETEDVHAYIHKEGWIVTYYSRNEPAAKIVDWVNYGTDGRMAGTKLEVGMLFVYAVIGIPMKNVKYYDFRYPDANRLMIVAEASRDTTEETFKIKLPSEFAFYERSYSFYSSADCALDWCYGKMYINGKEISRSIQRVVYYGLLQATELFVDRFITITLTSSQTFGAIVLVYREP